MRSVDIAILKNAVSEYVRLASGGETVVVMDRDRAVAELGPPRTMVAPRDADERWAEAIRQGHITPAEIRGGGPPPRHPVMSFDELMADLEQAREDR